MRPSRLDELLPHFDFEEAHTRRVGASPAAALAAVQAATLGEMPLVRLLFALRSGPARLTRGRGLPRVKGRPLWEQMRELEFVVLVDEVDEVVLGYAGQAWKLAGGSQPGVDSAADWQRFSTPGYVKAAMSFRAEAAEGGALLTTETRVVATDEASRRRFGRYWWVIRSGSGAIRRSWLGAAARRAEAAQEGLTKTPAVPSGRPARPDAASSVAPIATAIGTPCVLASERAAQPEDEQYSAKPS
ncbi:MAG: hypothetical protein M3R39_02060 [Actinomycetota bacterium]|nr:hypothetical protein [Actinomycetota bacterium]